MPDDLERLDRLIRYDSGREGDAYRISIAERMHGISLYVLALTEDGQYLAESGESPRGRFPWGCVPGGHTPGRV